MTQSISTLIAYHGRASEKQEILAVLAAHRVADEIVQAYGYWKDGKGCAVGCTLHSKNHMEYETRFGIPVALAYLEDGIFEGLPVELAREWPGRFMGAIKPGADLSLVQWKFLHWLLTDESVNPGISHPIVKDAVLQVAELIAVLADDGIVAARAAWSAASAESAAESARSARSAMRSATSAARAESAAASARSAAWSAAWSAASAESAAESAASARSAMWSTTSAARSAWSTTSAAWSAASAASAAWIKISDQLISLIEETKKHERFVLDDYRQFLAGDERSIGSGPA